MNYKKVAEDLFEDNLQKTEYVGVIEDIQDPKKMGRARVRVFGKTGHASGDQEIQTALLPWAYPKHFGFAAVDGGAQFSTPKVGAEVAIEFPDGNIYSPRYTHLINLSDKVKEAIANSYENAHVLAFDDPEQFKMYYTQEGGLLVYLKGSLINMKNDRSILISHDQNSAQLELRGNDLDIVTEGNVNISSKNNVNVNSNNVWANGVQTNIGGNPIFSAVNGEPLFALLKALATIVDAKMSVTAGSTVALVNQFEQFVLSGTVKTSG